MTTRPWEAALASAPWLAAQSNYSRTIAVTRPAADTGVGLGSYSQLQATTETAVIGTVTYTAGTSKFVSLTGVPATISNDASDRAIGGMIPASARRMEFRIVLPASAAALGTITEKDIVTDDLGKRYQVSAATWGPLGYNLRASLLEN